MSFGQLVKYPSFLRYLRKCPSFFPKSRKSLEKKHTHTTIHPWFLRLLLVSTKYSRRRPVFDSTQDSKTCHQQSERTLPSHLETCKRRPSGGREQSLVQRWKTIVTDSTETKLHARHFTESCTRLCLTSRLARVQKIECLPPTRTNANDN